MTIYVYDGQNITNCAFQHENGKNFLRDWILELDTPEKREALGIVEQAEPVPTKPSLKEQLVSEIFVLESQVTNRRLREAVLGIDNDWLALQEEAIKSLREQLKSA